MNSKCTGLGSPLGLVDTIVLWFASNFVLSLPRILRLTIMKLFISYILYLLKCGSLPKFWRYLPKKNDEFFIIIIITIIIIIIIIIIITIIIIMINILLLLFLLSLLFLNLILLFILLLLSLLI